MAEVKTGDTVSIHYTGKLTDGSVFDSSEGRDPLQFEVGSGQIIPGLDEAIAGMAEGEKKTVTVEPDQAYGPVNPDAMQSVPRSSVPAEIPLEVGTPLQLQTAEGQTVPVSVVEVNEESVLLDANHPLAGKTLEFEVEVVGIG